MAISGNGKTAQGNILNSGKIGKSAKDKDAFLARRESIEQNNKPINENKEELATKPSVSKEESKEADVENEVKTEVATIEEAKITEDTTTVKTKKNSSPKETKTAKDFLQFTPPTKETKDKRVGLLLKSSLHEKAQKKCKEIGISFNELISQFLEQWVD